MLYARRKEEVFMSYLRGIALVFLIFCPALTFAQDPTKTNDRTESTDRAINQPKLSDYIGSPFERFLLGWQYQYQYVEQPDFVLVTQPGNPLLLLRNPEHNLNQHSFTYDFSQVFLTPAQVARVRKVNPDFCSQDSKGNDRLTCVARAGGGARRFLSGLKITANIAEHPVAAQGSILPAGYLYGGEVDFNPTNLFTTGTDWKTSTSSTSELDKTALLATLNSKGCNAPLPDPKDKEAVKQDQINTVNCASKGLLAFRGPTRRTKLEAILYSMTPTFQYKRLTPFDFLKYAGTLMPSSNSGGLL